MQMTGYGLLVLPVTSLFYLEVSKLRATQAEYTDVQENVPLTPGKCVVQSLGIQEWDSRLSGATRVCKDDK